MVFPHLLFVKKKGLISVLTCNWLHLLLSEGEEHCAKGHDDRGRLSVLPVAGQVL